MVRRAPCSARLFHARVGQRLAARDRRPLEATPVRFRRQAVVESPSAIGAIPEAFLALLARSKSKGEPA
jgi:hypothetical protein